MALVLFVCTGNICRSPMGMALLQDRLRRDPERQDWRALSAGVWTEDGHSASSNAIEAMAERGLDLSDFRSRMVTLERVQEANLILAMTSNHVEALRQGFPQVADRVHLFSEMVGESYDIADPYMRSLNEYRVTAAELERIIDQGYEQIVKLAQRF